MFLGLGVLYLHLSAVAQAEKEKAVQNKAYNEAVRSHQREEEILGFRKIPVQPQGHEDFAAPARPESEDDDSVVFLFHLLQFDTPL